MKIDLHCHTLKTKIGDDDRRTVSKEVFKEKIIDSNVKIVGITNHNKFDFDQYKELAAIVKGDALVWPGIELDVIYKETSAHLIIIYNPNKVDEFQNLLIKVIEGKDPDEVEVDLEKIIDVFKNADAIFIAHSHSKAKSFSKEMIDLLNNGIAEQYRIFSEPANLKTLSILLDNGEKCIMGSDIKDWNKYPGKMLPELKLEIDSFDKFILLAKKDRATINTLLNKKEKLTEEFAFKINNKRQKIKLSIYNDVNVIFGTKGTGKTVLLNAIKDKFISNGLSVAAYYASDASEEMDNKLNNKEEERINWDKDIKVIDDLLKIITEWSEVNPTSLNKYVQHVKTNNQNRNKARLKITKLSKSRCNDTDLRNFEEEKKNIEKSIKQFEKLNLNNYIEQDEIDSLNLIFEKIKRKSKNLYIEKFINYYSIYLTNKTISCIKSKADSCTTTISIPDTTGLTEYVEQNLKLISIVKKYKQLISECKTKEVEKIGRLEVSKEIYLAKLQKVFDNKETGYKYGQTINLLKEITRLILSLLKPTTNINETMEELKKIIKEKNVKATDFIGILKRFENQNGEPYVPSDGEKIMLILMQRINEDKDVYILDEPERSLGNTFINQIVVPRLIELSKSNKIVVIATHNANIAVRTLPFVSILKCYENEKYLTYIGNPFTNELINIDDANDRREWKDESIRILEGGKEAFYDRRLVYESR